jgi:hypothetical protein
MHGFHISLSRLIISHVVPNNTAVPLVDFLARLLCSRLKLGQENISIENRNFTTLARINATPECHISGHTLGDYDHMMFVFPFEAIKR